MMKKDQDKLIESLSKRDVDHAIQLIKSHEVKDLEFLGLPLVMAAVLMNHYDLVEALLSVGADPNVLHQPELCAEGAKGTQGMLSADSLVDEKVLKDMAELGFKTPIHIATNSGSNELVKLLLNFGADANQPDLGHCTPLHWACMKGDFELAQLLLDYGANPNAQDLAQSTPLHEAIRKNRLAITQLLLKHHACVDIPDFTGTTALEASKAKPLIYQQLVFYANDLGGISFNS